MQSDFLPFLRVRKYNPQLVVLHQQAAEEVELAKVCFATVPQPCNKW